VIALDIPNFAGLIHALIPVISLELKNIATRQTAKSTIMSQPVRVREGLAAHSDIVAGACCW
jgi:hypothetical protein